MDFPHSPLQVVGTGGTGCDRLSFVAEQEYRSGLHSTAHSPVGLAVSLSVHRTCGANQ